MQNVDLHNTPKWTQVGEDWHMLIGNKSVARLTPVSEENFPHIHWLSIMDSDDYEDHGWHAVDFETLEIAMYDIEQWWQHMCIGEAFDPEIHCEDDCDAVDPPHSSPTPTVVTC
jgi:hypothetical protein